MPQGIGPRRAAPGDKRQGALPRGDSEGCGANLPHNYAHRVRIASRLIWQLARGSWLEIAQIHLPRDPPRASSEGCASNPPHNFAHRVRVASRMILQPPNGLWLEIAQIHWGTVPGADSEGFGSNFHKKMSMGRHP